MVPELMVTPIKRSRTEVYLHVLRALMLRDMRTRFGGSRMVQIIEWMRLA